VRYESYLIEGFILNKKNKTNFFHKNGLEKPPRADKKQAQASIPRKGC
jgi:hypothetical protein